VVSHHCPYSVGRHNIANGGKVNGYETEIHSACAVRVLVPLLHKYGVAAWLCGHDEIQEHSQHVGEETLEDGSKRRHVLNVYDLGSAGDGMRGAAKIANPLEIYRAYENAPDGVHYGHMRVEVKPNAKGAWQCSLTPMYSYMKDSSGNSELRAYGDKMVLNEDGSSAYEQHNGVTLMDGDGSVEVVTGVMTKVSAAVRKIKIDDPAKAGEVRVVHHGAEADYDITSAFAVESNKVGEVTFTLNPSARAEVDGETVCVTPAFPDADGDVSPLTVDETVGVGVKTIPGLTYRLKRRSGLSGAEQAEVVATQQAHGKRTVLEDPMAGGKPAKAFYTVEVGAE